MGNKQVDYRTVTKNYARLLPRQQQQQQRCGLFPSSWSKIEDGSEEMMVDWESVGAGFDGIIIATPALEAPGCSTIRTSTTLD
jgi:hypothetical protein